MLNSRIRDYYDPALLARLCPFEGALLIDAIHSTFRHCGTTVESNPVGLFTIPQVRRLVSASYIDWGWKDQVDF